MRTQIFLLAIVGFLASIAGASTTSLRNEKASLSTPVSEGTLKAFATLKNLNKKNSRATLQDLLLASANTWMCIILADRTQLLEAFDAADLTDAVVLIRCCGAPTPITNLTDSDEKAIAALAKLDRSQRNSLLSANDQDLGHFMRASKKDIMGILSTEGEIIEAKVSSTDCRRPVIRFWLSIGKFAADATGKCLVEGKMLAVDSEITLSDFNSKSSLTAFSRPCDETKTK